MGEEANTAAGYRTTRKTATRDVEEAKQKGRGKKDDEQTIRNGPC